jgi:fermentation-respiration switch protein FrsA (DUF1100 family)
VKSLLSFLVPPALAYLGVAALMFVLQRSLIYRPDPMPPDLRALAASGFEAVTLALPEGAAPALLIRPPRGGERALTVLHFHGNADLAARVPERLRRLTDDGWGLAVAEYPGYAGLPGRPDETSVLRAARLAAEETARRAGGAGNVVLWGSSLGSGVATALAGERDWAGVILEAPFTSLADAARWHYWWLPVDLLLLDRYDSLARIGGLRAPLLIVHGERDGVVPVAQGRRLLAAAPEPKRGVFPAGAGHEDLGEFGLGDAALGFLRERQAARR